MDKASCTMYEQKLFNTQVNSSVKATDNDLCIGLSWVNLDGHLTRTVSLVVS